MSPHPRSPFNRFGVYVAAGAVAALAAAGPAVASSDPVPPTAGTYDAEMYDNESYDHEVYDHEVYDHEARDAEARDAAPYGSYDTTKASPFKGRVIARSGLLLRDRPTRSSKVIGKKPYGAKVNIFCKTRGDNVDGNNRWYLLSNGTWAWGSAKYIENIGTSPRWC
ncbi:SH3 domain-containing protein [Streptomyces hypolithicus]